MKNQKKCFRKGFTLLEILLVVAAIAILAGIVIVAINPVKQMGETRNAQRHSDVTTILNAVYQYMIDSGEIPSDISVSADCNTFSTNEICKSGISTSLCSNFTDLNVLTKNQKYLVELPEDPSNTSSNGTGYYISSTADGRINVCAPLAEQGVEIEVTK